LLPGAQKAQFFKMYNTYGNNYDEASDMLEKCQQDERFKEIEEVRFRFVSFLFLVKGTTNLTKAMS